MAERLLQDLRYAVRQTMRAPGFAIAVVATLALAIGANAALFSLVNALLLRSLPVRNPDELVVLRATDERGRQNRPIYYSAYTELAKLPVFHGLALYSGGGIFRIEAGGTVNEGLIEASTPGLFETLGLRPHVGRFFTAEDSPGEGSAAPVVVLSYDFWMRAFGGDDAAIGQTVLISGTPAVVIGVTPPGYRGFYVDMGVGFSVPLTFLNRQMGSDPKRPVRGLNAIARLAPGVSLEQARAAVESAWPGVRVSTIPSGLGATEQKEMATQQMKVESLATGFSTVRNQYRDPLLAVSAIAAMLLVIGCINLSGLLLARTAARDQQLAIRLALGASRGRIAQPLVIESVLLSLMGTMMALPLAWWVTLAASAALQDTHLGRPLQSLTPDGHVLAVTAVIAIATALVMSVLPAWSACQSRPQAGLRPDRTVAHAHNRWSRVLLIAQVAISLVILVGAGLFASSLSKLRDHDIGVRMERLRWTRLFAVPNGYRDQNDGVYYPELVRQLSEVPGVQSLALATYFPNFFSIDSTFATQPITRAEATMDPSEAVDGIMENVTPRFFETLESPLLRGRDFTWSDDGQHTAVAIINESLSRKLFPNGDALGRRIRIGNDPKRNQVEVIGIAADAAIGGYTHTHFPVAYRPRMQELQASRAPALIFRITRDDPSVDDRLASVIARLGHEYPRAFLSLNDQVHQALLRERLLAGGSTFIAALGLVLVFVGLFAALTFAVTRRTREIGVRMALGSSRGHVIRMIVGESLVLTLLGVAIGIPCALGVGRLIASLLFGLEPSDPATLIAASLFIVIVGAGAAVRPALRASGVDPMTALRGE